MARQVWGLIIIVAVVVALGGLLVWWQQRTAPAPTSGLVVATTIFPLTDIVQQVGGDHVHVVQLIAPGASPHSATLTPQQLADAQQAKALFVIGHGLDTWVADAVSRTTTLPTVTVDRGITLRHFGANQASDPDVDATHRAGADSFDPHYWLTVPNAAQIAQTIADELVAVDPEHAQQYQDNLKSYQQQLTAAEAEFQQAAAAYHKNILLPCTMRGATSQRSTDLI